MFLVILFASLAFAVNVNLRDVNLPSGTFTFVDQAQGFSYAFSFSSSVPCYGAASGVCQTQGSGSQVSCGQFPPQLISQKNTIVARFTNGTLCHVAGLLLLLLV
jgi:hypothetical protein